LRMKSQMTARSPLAASPDQDPENRNFETRIRLSDCEISQASTTPQKWATYSRCST